MAQNAPAPVRERMTETYPRIGGRESGREKSHGNLVRRTMVTTSASTSYSTR